MTATAIRKSNLAARALRPIACGLAVLCALMLAGLPAQAQQKPSPAAIAIAKELIAVKGATNMFDPVIPGVIETAKNTFLKTNPQLSKDLNAIAAQLRTEYAGKREDLANEVAVIYAQHFTEQELKQALAFYKTPLGQKLITQEVDVLQESMTAVQSWADEFADQMLQRFRVEMRKRGHNI
jgi:hypothetical protein